MKHFSLFLLFSFGTVLLLKLIREVAPFLFPYLFFTAIAVLIVLIGFLIKVYLTKYQSNKK